MLVTKPAVKTLREHLDLLQLVWDISSASYMTCHYLSAQAETHGVLVMVEYHKRFDPIYTDAQRKAQRMGDFSFFNSFMSQPKFQLEVCDIACAQTAGFIFLFSFAQTFRAWAGKSSDIRSHSYFVRITCI